MKIFSPLAIPFIAAVLFSCDKVTDPIVKKAAPAVVATNTVKKNNKAISSYRKVFLEDYTGQRCVNCPAAAAIIHNSLVPQYTNSLVVISVHAGDLSTPFGSHFKNQDFRTEVGNVWNGNSGGFGINSWPTGLINRKNYNNNGLLLSSTKWTSVVPLGLQDQMIIQMDVSTEYDTLQRALNIEIRSHFKKSVPDDVNIIAGFYEDGIVGVQDDNGTIVEEYDFEHVFRGTFNGTWGTLLKSAPAAGDTASVTLNGLYLPETINAGKGKLINDKNVTVFVLASNAKTREVLQVEKIKIR